MQIENILICHEPQRNIPKMENKFITTNFLDACREPQFQNRWMTAETWCDVVWNQQGKIHGRPEGLPEGNAKYNVLIFDFSKCKFSVNPTQIKFGLSFFQNTLRRAQYVILHRKNNTNPVLWGMVKEG